MDLRSSFKTQPSPKLHHSFVDMNPFNDQISIDVDSGESSDDSVLTCTCPGLGPDSQSPVSKPETSRARSGPLKVEKDEEEDEDDEIIPDKYRRSGTYSSFLNIVQWVSLFLISVLLICTLLVPNLKKTKFKGFSIWKWEIFVLVVTCGNLVSRLGIRIIVSLIQRDYMLRKKFMYFVYALRNPVQNCIWLLVILLAWNFVVIDGVEPKSELLRILNKVLICSFVGTCIWLVKTILVKVLASRFHMSKFFDKIQESLFSQYVIETLLGPPNTESVRGYYREEDDEGTSFWGKLRRTQGKKFIDMEHDCELGEIGTKGFWGKLQGKQNKKFVELESTGGLENNGENKEERIPIDSLNRMNSKNVSVWNMKRLIKIIRRGMVSTIDERISDSIREDEATRDIGSEVKAKIAARKIFQNVAQRHSRFICKEDIMCFLSEDRALKTMKLLAGSPECEKISKLTLKNWVINAFRERKFLAMTLNDTKTAVNTLHQMVNILVGIVIVITSMLILGILTTKFLLFISSQVVVVAFVFGNTCKTAFEAIIFLFVMHPFDVGDRCEIDGVQMVVEEMNILTTVFLRSDNQRVVYPNSILATKSISNYHRSADIGDSIDFSVHITTPPEKIALMKQRIISYVKGKKEHWHPSPTIVLIDLEELNKIKFSLWLTHRMNFQDIDEKWMRRSLVVEEMIKIFNELDLERRFFPVDVNIRSMPPQPNASCS